MSVSVYAGTDPFRVEININGIVFVSLCTTFNAALVCAAHVVKALGLAPAEGITINGKPVAEYSTEEP